MAYETTNGEPVKRHKRGRYHKDLVSIEDQEYPFSRASRWDIETIEDVSRFLGMSFEGVKRQARDLFMALEREGSI